MVRPRSETSTEITPSLFAASPSAPVALLLIGEDAGRKANTGTSDVAARLATTMSRWTIMVPKVVVAEVGGRSVCYPLGACLRDLVGCRRAC